MRSRGTGIGYEGMYVSRQVWECKGVCVGVCGSV